MGTIKRRAWRLVEVMPVGSAAVDPARKAFDAGANAIVEKAVLKRILYFTLFLLSGMICRELDVW